MHVTKCATRKMLLDMRYTEYMAQHVPHYIFHEIYQSRETSQSATPNGLPLKALNECTTLMTLY